jgi:hypothetical protein
MQALLAPNHSTNGGYCPEQKKACEIAGFSMSAEGFEPSTNGLKERALILRFSQPVYCRFWQVSRTLAKRVQRLYFYPVVNSSIISQPMRS